MAAPAWVDIRTPPAFGDPLGLIVGYRGTAVEISDTSRAREFYSGLLGFREDGRSTEGTRLDLGGGQTLTLVERDKPRTVPKSGVHRAYRMPMGELDATLARLRAAGVEVESYHEDREAELRENRYLSDPDGNRIQLVAGPSGLDHVAFESYDLEWAEVFYTQVLGARVELRVGWTMADYARAWKWGNGEDECAPGTRRWDKLYTDEQQTVARSNAQLFVRFAERTSLGIYLANVHRQEPPPWQFRGTPRTAFWVRPGGLNDLEARLRSVRLRCMEASERFGGPYERIDDALYVRDTGGSFLEFREG